MNVLLSNIGIFTERVMALYPYQAQNEDELTFEKGDVITVLAKDEATWWKGELNGVSGVFPSNYVSPMCKYSKTLLLIILMNKKLYVMFCNFCIIWI